MTDHSTALWSAQLACQLALEGALIQARNRYFPTTYAQATWHRLELFFRLPGRIVWSRNSVQVELRPFNDRRLACDLAALCQLVAAARPRLPDGRRLVLREASASCFDSRCAA